MDPEKVEEWLGSCGADTEAIELEDDWTSVEGWSLNTERHVAILIHPDIPERFATSVRDASGVREAIIAVGEHGVRELGRWLMDDRTLEEFGPGSVERGP